MKSRIYAAFILLFLLSLTLHAQVRISEFMASNTRTLLDEDGQTSDWIELQNTTTNTVSLLNWSLTDSPGNPGKWRFPATNLPPKSFLIVFASGKRSVGRGAGIAHQLQTRRGWRVSGPVRAGWHRGHGNRAAVSTTVPQRFLRHRHAACHDHAGRPECADAFPGFPQFISGRHRGRRQISTIQTGPPAPTALVTKPASPIRRKKISAQKFWRPDRCLLAAE